MPHAPGLAKLFALAKRGLEWRNRILMDPVRAARDAGIALTDTELEILGSVTGPQLKTLLGAFEAAGTELADQPDRLDEMVCTLGHTPDIPPPDQDPLSEDEIPEEEYHADITGIMPDEPPAPKVKGPGIDLRPKRRDTPPEPDEDAPEEPILPPDEFQGDVKPADDKEKPD